MKTVLVTKEDLDISWFSGGGGGGGQHKNRHNNCCRITHKESKAQGQSTNHKSAKENQRQAFINMTDSIAFKSWLQGRLEEIRTGKTIEERVKEQMKPSNLKIETVVDGQWVEYED